MRWSGVSEAQAYRIASEQHGLITRAQLRTLGASDRTIERRLQQGTFERLFPGVFRLLPSPRSGWHQRLKGLCLWLGGDAAVSHAAAAKLWEADGAEELAIEVTTTRAVSGNAPEGVVIHRTRSLTRDAVTEIDGIRVTKMGRTLLDMASSVPTDAVDAALDWALRHDHTTFKQLARMLAKMKARGRPGLRTLTRLVDRRNGGRHRDSEAERRFVRDVIEAHGLPMPKLNVPIRNASGHIIAHVDAAYPELGIVIEIYSRAHHTSPQQVQRDTARQNELVLAGYVPHIFWWEDIEQTPRETAGKIAAAISCSTGETIELADAA